MLRRRLLVGAGGVLLTGGAGVLGWRGATGSMAAYDRYTADLRRPLPPDASTADLIRFATLAANGHNTQPWRFRVEGQTLAIRPDLARATPVVDPDDHHLFVSLGCAAENLALAAAASGRQSEAAITPEGGVAFALSPVRTARDPLVEAIPQRQSTRATYDGREVPAGTLAALVAAARVPGVRLVILTRRAAIDQVRDLVIAGNAEQMGDPAFIAELKHWLRFSPRAAMTRGDGLFSAASGNPVLPQALGGLAFDAVFTVDNETDRYARQMDSSTGVAIFLADRADREGWIAVGRACQRFALAATLAGVRHAFVSQPVEVAALRPALAALAGEPGLRPDLMLRFGYGPLLPFSPRRPVDAVAEGEAPRQI